MKKNNLLLILFLIVQPATLASAAGAIWQNRSAGILEQKVNCLYADPSGRYILAGTDQGIYRKTNLRDQFDPVLYLLSHDLGFRMFSSGDKGTYSIYAAAGSGVYVSRDEGMTWHELIYSGESGLKDIKCILGTGKDIFAGTQNGLYVHKSNETLWQAIHFSGSQKPVVALDQDEKFVYVATDSAVFRLSKLGAGVKQIYSLESRELDHETPVNDVNEVDLFGIKGIAVSKKSGIFYIASASGILSSRDYGQNWSVLPGNNLPLKALTKLVILNEELCAVTREGFFRFRRSGWQKDILGLTNIWVRDAAFDKTGHYFLAGGDGFYIRSDPKPLFATQSEVEPTIAAVQRMAVEYANVDPDQIKKWHHQARLKAMVPNLSAGINRGATDIYHWDSGPNPDVLQKGRDYLDWNTSLSWNLGDLIWSADQTTIDSRSKLMNEIRQDILDRVTRLYFERKRIMLEIDEKGNPSQLTFSGQELQVEELTALIDGYTGGRFSKALLKTGNCLKEQEKK